MRWIEQVPAWIAALPWLALPLVILIRLRGSRHLAEYEPARGPGVPRVSVIVPARNEAENIERCVTSLLLTTYANAEFIVVDDHSSDGTGAIAQAAIGDDARARITTPPPLPAGWFGKQWACAHGATLATGELLLFTDADTWHSGDCLGRSVAALQARGSDLLSLLGRQEMVTFWEQVGQPPAFLGIVSLMGSAEAMSQSRDYRRKAANGQYLLMRRDAYDALDGHAAVRMYVAEDVMFARAWTAAGRAVHMLVALDQLSTRMYRSLDDVIRGWGKNAWAGGKHLVGTNAAVRAVARIISPILPFAGLIPHAAFLLGISGVLGPWWIAFGVFGYVYETAGLAAIYSTVGFPLHTVFLYPLGCFLTAYIFARASIRGDRTEWKGREYQAA